ncbi:MAG TPA: TetR/AcrR family transcriptional regulator C-terminal domain-containing protein, partial [Ktedonobacterales bacterium]|nr:TetR/AcrR family transcriptional regulator C-terminal domain-containing protein [Ktedonobacterales bacterium]
MIGEEPTRRRRRRLRSPRHGGLDRAFAPEPRPERRGLDRAQIIEAALALLDEVGLEGLTMRRLAERLGVKAASLYWHVQDKDDVLDLMADAICAEIRPPAKDLSWRVMTEELAWECRRVYLSHRDAALVLAATPPLGPNRIRLMELAFSVLLQGGFMPRDAVYAGFLVNDFIIESVTDERRAEDVVATRASGEESFFADFQRYLTSLPAETYPAIIQLADFMSESDPEPRFRFGLATILDGLEQRLA